MKYFLTVVTNLIRHCHRYVLYKIILIHNYSVATARFNDTGIARTCSSIANKPLAL